jgi:hypothetical protein
MWDEIARRILAFEITMDIGQNRTKPAWWKSEFAKIASGYGRFAKADVCWKWTKFDAGLQHAVFAALFCRVFVANIYLRQCLNDVLKKLDSSIAMFRDFD